MNSSPHPCIFPWDESRAFRHERGFKLPFVDEHCGARQLRMHVSELKPGESPHPPHAHAGEEIIFLIEGQVEVLIGEETRRIGPMTAVFCPEHVMHGLHNYSTAPARFMVIRVP
jgi:quercetin dioxygenase-like cupin family protein